MLGQTVKQDYSLKSPPYQSSQGFKMLHAIGLLIRVSAQAVGFTPKKPVTPVRPCRTFPAKKYCCERLRLTLRGFWPKTGLPKIPASGRRTMLKPIVPFRCACLAYSPTSVFYADASASEKFDLCANNSKDRDHPLRS